MHETSEHRGRYVFKPPPALTLLIASGQTSYIVENGKLAFRNVNVSSDLKQPSLSATGGPRLQTVCARWSSKHLC